MRDKDGKRIAEILYGQVGEGVDLYRSGKGCHDSRSKTVYQTLHGKNAQIHDGLLHTGESGEVCDLFDSAHPETYAFFRADQMGKLYDRINRDADAGHILRDDGGSGRSCHAPVKDGDKIQIQHDVQAGGHCQKYKRNHGITERPEEGGKKVIKKYADHSRKDDQKVLPHHVGQLRRRPEKPDDPVDAGEDQNIKDKGHSAQQAEGGEDAFFETGVILLPEPDREYRTAPHGKTQEDGGKKRHEREGGADGCQCICSQKPPYDQGIRDVITLLQQVAQDHGNREAEHRLHDRTMCQFIFHCDSPLLSLCKILINIR